MCRRSPRQSIARLIRLRSKLTPPPGSENFTSMIPRPENCFAKMILFIVRDGHRGKTSKAVPLFDLNPVSPKKSGVLPSFSE